MNKLMAVLKREYLQAVRKKMFIIMTFLMPVLMAAVLILPSMIMARGMGEKKIAIVDGTGALGEAFQRGVPAAADEPTALRRSRRNLPDNMKT